MRGKLLAAALMASTALTPRPAAAEPVSTFVTAFIAGFGGGSAITASLATAIGGATAAGYAVGAFLGTTILGQVLLSVGLSYLSSVLAGKMGAVRSPSPSQIYRNFAQDISYFQWVFGEARIGGPLGFTGASRANDPVTGTQGWKRHYTPIFAAHSCDSVTTHYLDEREVEIDADGLVTTAPYVFSTESGSVFNGGIFGGGGVTVTTSSNVRIRPFLGHSGQTADPAMVSIFPEITSAHDFAGLTGAHIWARNQGAESFTKVYPTGREPAYTPVIKGMDTIYDPRTDSYGYSNNAALIIAAWLTKVWGRSVDWAEVATEADICDQLVTNRDGVQQKRWTIGWSFTDDTDFETQRAQLCGACDAFIYEREDGKIGFRVGRYEAPTVTLTDDDILSISVSEGAMGRDLPTEVVATYTEPKNAWREANTGPYVITEAERLVTEEPKIYAATSHNQAARLCKRIAKVKRYARSYQITLSGAGFKLFGQRFVRIKTALWDEVIEVGEFGIDGGVFFLNGTSTQASDFDFDAATEEPTPPNYAAVATADTVSVPTGFTGSVQSGGAIKYIWDAQSSDLQQQIQLRESGGDWETVTLPQGQSVYTATGLPDGAQIEAQIRNRTSGGKVSAWSASETVTVVQNTTAPAALDAFDATATGFNVDVAFTAPNDPNYFATRIYRGTTTTFADAALVRTEYGIPSNADAWTDTGLATGTYYYWGVPINPSGIPADDGTLPATGSGPVSVTI
ncbi:hypothetical protein DEM26_18250 [Thioclava sp. NG1]|uniref:phage tail protein n=1 Tax=Thioclava sp. NG1 TaxID=2182426 RepID=UPI000D614BAE|nr:phage tail protein [Thioclava sp. NG1]PWE48490.1 hypothetical protein DEM26_18250 [Thioclava sp. NG1]